MVNRQKPMILVVEDDDVMCDALRGLLSEEFDAVCVGTLASARRLLAGDAFDLLLVDLMLTDGDGAELFADARARRLPVVVVSAKHGADRIAADHAVDFVRKPFADADLVATIRTRLRPAVGG